MNIWWSATSAPAAASGWAWAASTHAHRHMTRLDSPCIAVCTTLYDEVCKGCGRTYMEVAQWSGYSDDEREVVWLRIDAEATSWRYNKYKDRVPK